MKALTDSGPTEMNSVRPECIENLFTILKVVSAPDTYDYFNEKWNSCEIRYGDLKKQLAADIIKVTSPIRERYMEISNDNAYLHKVVTEGAEKARASALKTITGVREIMGFRSF